MKISSFDWDDGNLEKLKKHRISTSIAEEFFSSSEIFIINDRKHSFIEPRFIAFGRYLNRDMYIAFTFRANSGILKIRIISARYVHKKELGRMYEEIKS